jgi:hypothetical protein
MGSVIAIPRAGYSSVNRLNNANVARKWRKAHVSDCDLVGLDLTMLCTAFGVCRRALRFGKWCADLETVAKSHCSVLRTTLNREHCAYGQY